MAFGTNDAMLPGHLQYVPLPQYRVNLTGILRHLTHCSLGSTSLRFILVTPAPIYEAKALETDRKRGFEVMRRREGNTALYAQGVRDVGKELGIPVLDLWELIEADSRKSSNEVDRDQNERFNKYFSDGEFSPTPACSALLHPPSSPFSRYNMTQQSSVILRHI